MAKYRKKPVVIEAFYYNGGLKWPNGKYYVPNWAVKAFKDGIIYYKEEEDLDESSCELFIDTLEGTYHVSVGDYIIKGGKMESFIIASMMFLRKFTRRWSEYGDQ